VRVLIALTGAIGDVVRALPLLGRIRRGRPDAHVTWVVEPPSAPLLEGHPWLDELIVFPRAQGIGGFMTMLRRVRAGRPDVALDLGRGAKTALIVLGSGAKTRLGFARADAREGSWLAATRHLPAQGTAQAKIAQLLAFGDLLDLPPAPVEFGLAPTAAESDEAESLTSGLPRPIIAACLGSSCPSRRWFPDDTAAALSDLAAQRRASAVLLGTAADAPFAAEVARATRATVRDLTGRTSLRQLMAVLARTDVAFGPDSGALHVAAAVGTPVVSLWGATSADRSAPHGSEHHTLQGDAPCAPCFLRDCPIGRICMRAISAERVVHHALEALAA
jgi:lipopolysaccharide heptosyltransferase I